MENILKVITNILKVQYRILERVFMFITNIIVNIFVPMLVMLVLLIGLVNVVLYLLGYSDIIVFIGSMIVLAIIPWYSSYLQKWLRGE